MSHLTLSKKGLFPTWANDLFDTGLWDFDGGISAVDLGVRVPSVNITEDDKGFKIEMAAPGLERKDFKVEVEKGMLIISSEKEEESNEEKKNYTRREYSYNSFSRSFALPDNSMPEKINAKYENGILSITLPKKEITVSKPAKEIEVL